MVILAALYLLWQLVERSEVHNIVLNTLCLADADLIRLWVSKKIELANFCC